MKPDTDLETGTGITYTKKANVNHTSYVPPSSDPSEPPTNLESYTTDSTQAKIEREADTSLRQFFQYVAPLFLTYLCLFFALYIYQKPLQEKGIYELVTATGLTVGTAATWLNYFIMPRWRRERRVMKWLLWGLSVVWFLAVLLLALAWGLGALEVEERVIEEAMAMKMVDSTEMVGRGV